MGTQHKQKNRDLSRQAEENYLEQTLDVVKDNLTNYGREVSRMQEDIDEMLAHYHDNDVEVLTILNNTVTMHDHMKRALLRNEKALNKPYFGRIIFHDEALDKEESIYIGRGGISKDTTHWMVTDWRAPVANAYYENGLGKCSYEAPGGTRIQIDLEVKRTYEIESGRLLEYFDSEVIANDDLLTKYLAKNKQAVLSEIVATIQKEQNEIIRKSPYHNMIVQGVAGSGKTTVAMHRISYILYNYEERFKPDDFYIVGSNRILLNYITGVLPDLDVYGIRQMTMEQLFIRLLYEDWDDKKYRIKGTNVGRKSESSKGTGSNGKNGETKDAATGGNGDSIKGSSVWFKDLEKYCRKLECDTISCKSVYLNPKQFVEGIRDGKIGVFDESDGQPADPRNLVCLIEGDAVERYIRQNPTVSVQSKINMLNTRLRGKIKEEFLGKGIKYTEAERKAILKAYHGHYGGRVWKQSIYELYQDFLLKQKERGYDVNIPDTEFNVYDLAALAYLYKRVKETEVISEAHHIVIDEAQDFGMMAYLVLKFCIYRCTYTIMGDVSQNIHFGYGLNDWEELKNLFLTDSMDSFGILKKSYRNTVEISDFATNILHHGRFSIYPVEPIIRHGSPVQVRQASDSQSMIREAAEICRRWQTGNNALETIAIVCRDQEEAAAAAQELSQYIDVMESDPEKTEFGSGIMVLPVEYTKGLEFDAVLILNPSREKYPTDDGHAKLLYVAATRALHELCVLHIGNLTGLIADPVPERGDDGKNVVNSTYMTEVSESMREKNAGPVSGNVEKHAVEKRVRESIKTDKRMKKTISIVRNQLQDESNVESGDIDSQSSATSKPDADLKRSAIPKPNIAPKPNADLNPSVTLKPNAPSKQSVVLESTARLKSSIGKAAQESTTTNLKTDADHVNRIAIKKQETESQYIFGDMPPTEKLSPPGHGKIDLAVKWVTKQQDGLYLHSRYGVLRLSPIGSAIVRVTFAKGGQIVDRINDKIAVHSVDKRWMYKESGSTVDLMTDELFVQVDKGTGAIRYMTRNKKLLLAERSKECRQLESTTDGRFKTWLYLDWQKKETIYGMGAGDNAGMNLRKTARYISHGNNIGELPFILSDQGYGMVLAADSPVMCCDIPAYGSYLHAESEEQMDFYFITGKRQNTIMNAYAYLCGKL
ncbi:MAG: AAA family ATPase [Lachnospiraceae bacterium]|nr:AAA family ATPase [Lachnospiraceae bacterium]